MSAGYYGRDAVEHALSLWREGWKQAHRSDQPVEWYADYLAAVASVADRLRSRRTMQELCAWYYHTPPIPEVARALDTVIHTAGGRVLNRGTVEDAAYWRRARELAAASSDAGASGEGSEGAR